MKRFKFSAKSKISLLPKTSGVYCFKSGRELIYIGKAGNIKGRVRNHFNPARIGYAEGVAGGAAFKDNILSEKTTQIGYLETGSEIEALILEANLIKKYQPKHNVVWRDDKKYFYAAISYNSRNIPYIFITHQKNHLKAEYIGPFVEGAALKKTLRFLRRVFPYYTVKKHQKTKCLYCHLGLCPGPYAPAAESGLGEYKKNIKKLILILKGKRSSVLKALKKEMSKASKEQNFEDAGKLRDKIFALQQVMAHAHVINGGNGTVGFLPFGKKPTVLLGRIIGIKNNILSRIECYDVSNIQGKQATGAMAIFTNGAPDTNQYRKFKIRLTDTPNDIAMLKETLQRRFNHPEWPYPEVILIDGGKAQLNAAVKILDTLSMRSSSQGIKIISIAKGRQELFIEGKKKPVPLKALPQEVYNLIKRLDDEAHRFAVAYHKKLRKRNLLQ